MAAVRPQVHPLRTSGMGLFKARIMRASIPIPVREFVAGPTQKTATRPGVHSIVLSVTEYWRGEIALLRSMSRNALHLPSVASVLFSPRPRDRSKIGFGRETPRESQRDPIVPVLEAFLAQAELRPVLSVCVSQACASSLAALFLGQHWLRQKRVDLVLVLAVDHAGPFIQKGFGTLKIPSQSTCRPFAKGRDGVVLGDAAAAILLCQAGDAQIELADVATETEGFAVTRPDQSGQSLRRACESVRQAVRPDLVIAHGTATQVNDAIEDQVHFELWGGDVPITATKWSVGHTLGTSAALDVIAACEVLKRQKAFGIGNTQEVDPTFRSRYLLRRSLGDIAEMGAYENIVVTSLGFGGVHAAAWLRCASGSSRASQVKS